MQDALRESVDAWNVRIGTFSATGLRDRGFKFRSTELATVWNRRKAAARPSHSTEIPVLK